jgi:hypothetical protein
MRYVVLIHSNPQPWGHPTGDFVAENQALPQSQRDRMKADFVELFTQMQANGEILSSEGLDDPATARLHRWVDGQPAVADGPYSQTGEHLAGFFVIDVADAARAEEIGRRLSAPGQTVELRPAVTPTGEHS